MKGKIIQFRRGRHTVTDKHFLVEVEGVSDKKAAEKLAGKKVEWKSPAGKKISGTISTSHGNKGLVRVIFEIGLPGQALTQGVEIK